jgi:hypothetical protein
MEVQGVPIANDPGANIYGALSLLQDEPETPAIRKARIIMRQAFIQTQELNSRPPLIEARTRTATQVEETTHDSSREGDGARPPQRRPSPPRRIHRLLPREDEADSRDLREYINEHRDARSVINNRRRERLELGDNPRGFHDRATRHPDSYDGFSAIVRSIRERPWPAKFKPAHIDKFNGKQNPEQWLRLYSTAVQAAGGNNDDKVNYFPVALADGPLQWLQQLPKNSIDSWDSLIRLFTSTFHGNWAKPPGLPELKLCKQEPGETLRSYTRRFFELRSTMINLTDKDVIETYIEGLVNRNDRRELGRKYIPDAAALRDIASKWADEEDKESTRKVILNKSEGKKKVDQQRDQGTSSTRKRRPDNLVAAVDQRPRKNKGKDFKDYKDLLKQKCPLPGHNSHTLEDCTIIQKAWGLPSSSKEDPKKD